MHRAAALAGCRSQSSLFIYDRVFSIGPRSGFGQKSVYAVNLAPRVVAITFGRSPILPRLRNAYCILLELVSCLFLLFRDDFLVTLGTLDLLPGRRSLNIEAVQPALDFDNERLQIDCFLFDRRERSAVVFGYRPGDRNFFLEYGECR